MSAGLQPEPRSTSAGILVIDDYAPNLTALEALLSPIAAVTVAGSGPDGLAELGRRDYAVVVLDVQMPHMSGLDVAKRIRSGSSNAQVPIIFLTAADGGGAEVLDGYAAGAVDYLRRPIEPVILRSKVSIFVELHERREQARHEAAARTRLEAERAASERASQEKDRFLALLTHELRTPLTSILLWSDMLLAKELPPETMRRGLRMVDLSARREAHMVDNVLELSRVITGALVLDVAPLDLDGLLADTLAEVAGLAAERGVRIACGSPASRRCAHGDRSRLRRILYNLL